SAAAGLFPCEVLVKNVDFVPRARKLLTAHRAGRSAADNYYLCHDRISLMASKPVRGRGTLQAAAGFGNQFSSYGPHQVVGKTTRQNPAKSIAPKRAVAAGDAVTSRTTFIPHLCSRQNNPK